MSKYQVKSRQLNVSCPADVYLRFQQFYPSCLSRFVRNCLKIALNDQQFFQSVFFYQGE